MSRRVLMVACLLLVIGGLCLQRAAGSTMAFPSAAAEVPQQAVRASEPVGAGAVIPPPVVPVGVPLPTAVEIPVLSSAEEAREMVDWWQRQDSWVNIDTFQQLYGDHHDEGQPLRMYASGGDHVVVRFPGHGRHGGGWAELTSEGQLLACERESEVAAPPPEAVEIEATIQERIAIVCWRLGHVDPQQLTMMSFSRGKSLPLDEWKRVCGNWCLDARTTDFTESSPNGGSSGGTTFAISLGEDGILRNYSTGGWRGCRRVYRCGTRVSASDQEPPLPTANN